MKRVLSIAVLVLTLAWIGFIFSNSLDSGIESGEKSGKVYEIVNDVAHSLGATEEIPESTIRTSAHFTEFAVLGILVCADIVLLARISPASSLGQRHAYPLLTLPFCVIIAIIDETIQRFSPGRAMQFIDIVIDCSGALCGMLFYALCFLFLHALIRYKRHIQNEPTT